MRIDFTVTDTRSDCEPASTSTHIEFAVSAPSLFQTTAMMKPAALDKLAKGDAEKSLQTLSVLTAAVLTPPPPPLPSPADDGNSTSTNTSAAPRGPPPTKTVEEEGKEMEARDDLVTTVAAMLKHNIGSVTTEQADLMVSTLNLVVGGEKPAVLATATCLKVADMLLLLASTGKISPSQTDSFASTALNVFSNINGDTQAEHEILTPKADPTQQKHVVLAIVSAVEDMLTTLVPPADSFDDTAESKPVTVSVPVVFCRHHCRVLPVARLMSNSVCY